MRTLLGILFLISVITSCADHASENPALQIPVTLIVPSDAGHMARTPGDPGVDVGHPLPKYLNLYVNYAYTENGRPVQRTFHRTYALNEQSWIAGSDSNGNAIWVYQERPTILLPVSFERGRVLAIASSVPITTRPADVSALTENELQNLSFDISGYQTAEQQSFLKELYATPWNDPGNGSIAKDGKVYRVTVKCYHVAAKVDVQWEVNRAVQYDRRLESITLTGLPERGFFFKPAENEGGTKTCAMLCADNLTPANQWCGRVSGYVLQKRGGVLNWSLKEMNKPETPFVTEPQNFGGTAGDPFAGWYNIQVRIGFPKP